MCDVYWLLARLQYLAYFTSLLARAVTVFRCFCRHCGKCKSRNPSFLFDRTVYRIKLCYILKEVVLHWVHYEEVYMCVCEREREREIEKSFTQRQRKKVIDRRRGARKSSNVTYYYYYYYYYNLVKTQQQQKAT